MPIVSPHSTAVVLMAKAPVPGRVKTRLCPPLHPEAAAALAHAFLRDAAAKLRTLRAISPHLAFTPAEAEPWFQKEAGESVRILPQEGADLGERMDRLVRRLLEEGHPAVVLVGTDLPTLPGALLQTAVDLLAEGDTELVLGPAEDGGYYLIGLRRPAPALFAELPWGGPEVLSATLQRAANLRLTVRLLPAWFDVDTPADLARLRRALRTDSSDAPHTRCCLAELFPADAADSAG